MLNKSAIRQAMRELRKKTWESYMLDPNGYYNLIERYSLPAILPFIENESQIVSGFYPVNQEFDCVYLLRLLKQQFNQRIALPVVVGKNEPLIFREWDGLDDSLIPATFKVPVPNESFEEVEPDVVLSPMIAFNSDKIRLGYGSGYYDRTLALLRKKKQIVTIGVGFKSQFSDEIPIEEHDEALDAIVTEEGRFL